MSKVYYSNLVCKYCNAYIASLCSSSKYKEVIAACEVCCEKIDKWDSMIKTQENERERKYGEARERYGEDSVICPVTLSPVDLETNGIMEGLYWCDVCCKCH